MGTVLGLVNRDQLIGRSQSSLVKESDVQLLDWYIDIAEALIDAQGVDKTKTQYALNVGYAVIKLAEWLIINDDEQNLMALFGPFSEEKMGSYQYKIKMMEQQGWPPTVERILKMYNDIGDPQDWVQSTRVFPEVKSNGSTGWRKWVDILDERFYRNFELSSPEIIPNSVP